MVGEQPFKELHVNPSVETQICRCGHCMDQYASQGLSFLLRRKIEEDKSTNTKVLDGAVDETMELDANFDLEKMGIKALEKMPRSVALEVSSKFRDFLNAVKSEISTKVSEGCNTLGRRRYCHT